MALRDQPYLPLYVQDFMTDEKLAQCSAESAGVYIYLMCILHKCDEYGKILLKQKDKQTDKQIKNFALKLGKQMPFSDEVIERSLTELVEEKVIQMGEDTLFQGRMMHDNDISLKRSSAGKTGGTTTGKILLKQNKKQKPKFAKAKNQANPEYENDNESNNVFSFKKELLKLGATEKLITDWLKVRKNKKATDTETAFDGFKLEYEKSKLTIDQVLKKCIEKNWMGFKSQWIENETQLPQSGPVAVAPKDLSNKNYTGTKF